MPPIQPPASQDAPTLTPDRALALAAAPPDRRNALAALFALDVRLGGIVRATREPMVGQMRLTWWHDALVALDVAPAPAEPLLRDVERTILPLGVAGAWLAAMIEGWEELIASDTLDRAALGRHAAARGGGMFRAAGRILGADSALLDPAGRGWALADLATHLSLPAVAASAAALAQDDLDQAFSAPWPRALRPIGLLSLIAKQDRMDDHAIVKVLRVVRFRITGR